jgi:hypothetical protein
LLADRRYRDKVNFGHQSMYIKVNLGINVEILPVVFKTGNQASNLEPFVLYRPESGRWEDGYARYHQRWLSMKNADQRTQGNFIPAIEVLKHIRSLLGLKAVSFHIECLLHFLADSIYVGGPADYLASIFRAIAAHKPDDWYRTKCMTPCGDRDILTGSEWSAAEWWKFHETIARCSVLAEGAIVTQSAEKAIEWWQAILGKDFFPSRVP